MGLFNFDTIQKEVGAMNAPYMNQVDLGKSQAKLYLFTPKIIPTQVLRPFKYNFSDELINDLNDYESMARAVAPAGGGLTKSSINMAILPDTVGMPLDMNTFSNQWSFVLIIDDHGPFVGIKHAVQTPATRIITTGYIVDEPIHRPTMTSSNPSLNPNAILVFTHTSILHQHNKMGQSGFGSLHSLSHNADLVSEINAQVANQDVYVMTPHDLRTATHMSMGEFGGKEFTGAYGGLSLSNSKQGEPCRKIQGSLNSPKHHLADIMHGADAALAATKGEYINSTVVDSVTADEDETFRTKFQQCVTGSNSLLPRHGLNTDMPASLGELKALYPSLSVQPFEIPNQSTWGVTPQTMMAKKTVMSSLVSAALSSLIPGSGLANISFRYSSWVKTDQFSSMNPGVWEVQGFGTLMESTAQNQMKALNVFKQVVETQLFPILLAFGGEFDLMAFVNITGETLIDLNYLDETSEMLGEGFYETTNRLGGINNPNTANAQILDQNAFELEKLVNIIGINNFGKDSPTDHTNYNQSGMFNTVPTQQPIMPNNGGLNNGNGNKPGYYL